MIFMKITQAQILTLIAFTLAGVSMAVPAAIGWYGERFRSSWLWGLYFDTTIGFEFGYAESFFVYVTPVSIVTMALGIGHLVHSLVSKSADKWLNRVAGSILVFFTAFSYLIGMYIGGGLFIFTSVPVGLALATVAGLLGFWSSHLMRQEGIPERQPTKEGISK
jgi:hypothetical protein